MAAFGFVRNYADCLSVHRFALACGSPAISITPIFARRHDWLWLMARFVFRIILETVVLLEFTFAIPLLCVRQRSTLPVQTLSHAWTHVVRHFHWWNSTNIGHSSNRSPLFECSLQSSMVPCVAHTGSPLLILIIAFAIVIPDESLLVGTTVKYMTIVRPIWHVLMIRRPHLTGLVWRSIVRY